MDGLARFGKRCGNVYEMLVGKRRVRASEGSGEM
jgi:hypothetical protein